MIRAMVLRALVLTAAVAVASAPVPCLAQAGNDKPSEAVGEKPGEAKKPAPPKLPAKATKKLSPEMLALLREKAMSVASPILLRVFKQEAELEVWKRDASGSFALLKTYPICRWSGDLGPKLREGDGQTPEGFYRVTPAQMNPHSNYHLAMNIGYPNVFDRANGRDGSLIMIHGDCWSVGCFAMTDEQIGEVYALAREAFAGGQASFQVQSYPFRMTPLNLVRHRNNRNLAFWTTLKTGNDHFEATHLEPRVDICNRAYVFNAQRPPKSAKPLAFSPAGPCPAYAVDPDIAQRVSGKQRADDVEYARLLADNAPAAPVYSELDGGMNEAFLAQFAGRISLSRRIGLDLARHPVELLMGEHQRMIALGLAELAERRVGE